VDALLAHPPLTDEAAGPAAEVLPGLIGKATKRAAKHLKAAHAHPAGHERDLELHEMRKAGKRLRYAAEVSEPALGKKAKRLVKAVKELQELLGEHQDSYVARDLLRELGAAAAAEGANGFAYGWLLRDEQARAEGVEADVDDAWATVKRRAAAVTG
jgi:CHAD domain-containing protein